MDELDEFYSKIQALLMKKNAEYGELKLISSKLTEENAEQIDSICNNIKNIFISSGIAIDDNVSTGNEKCVAAYEYLLFNTNFTCQEQLSEDIAKGHLVDMCPPLSPYLLLSVLYYLHYDDILATSLINLPVELSTEINTNVRRHVSIMCYMNYKRRQVLIFNLIVNSTEKLFFMLDNPIQCLNIETELPNFITSIQELITFAKEKKLAPCDTLEDDAKIKKTEYFGWLIKDLIKLVQDVIEKTHGVHKINADIEKLYRVTFGRSSSIQADAKMLKDAIDDIIVELLNLLVAALEEININTYLDWASYTAPDNPSLSLQQSIGIDCYNFKNILAHYNGGIMMSNEMLINCLEQLSSKPQEALASNIAELCRGIDDGKVTCMKELMTKHDAWNPTIFSYITRNTYLLDKYDLSIILHYLTSIIKNGPEDYVQDVYHTVLKIWINCSINDIYDTTLSFILHNDAQNTLESDNTAEMFDEFIRLHTNLKNVNSLKWLMLFMIKNPEKYLGTLIKMCIGCPEYINVSIPQEDLFLLSPIMKFHSDDAGTKFICRVLGNIGRESESWEFKRYNKLIMSMISKNCCTADELVNSVFIPMLLQHNLPLTPIKSILHLLNQLFPQFDDALRLNDLMMALTTRITQLRKNNNICILQLPKFPKHLNDELLMMATRLVVSILHHYPDWLQEQMKSRDIIRDILEIIYPIDQICFAKLLDFPKGLPDITDIMTDYRRRVRNALLLAHDLKDPVIEPEYLDDDFKLHCLLSSTDIEYTRLATELTVVHWDYFTKNHADVDENDAFDDFMKLYTLAMRYCLELPHVTSPAAFPCLVKSFVGFIKNILRLQDKWDTGRLLTYCRRSYQDLSSSIKDSGYDDAYEEVMVLINNTHIVAANSNRKGDRGNDTDGGDDSKPSNMHNTVATNDQDKADGSSSKRTKHDEQLDALLNLVEHLDNFGNKCLAINVEIKPRDKISDDVAKHLICQEIIGISLEYKNEYSSTVVRTINKLKSTQ